MCIEIVEMPGGAVMLTVDDGESDGSSGVGSKDSMFGASTIGGVTSAPDTLHLDKIIKKEIVRDSNYLIFLNNCTHSFCC